MDGVGRPRPPSRGRPLRSRGLRLGLVAVLIGAAASCGFLALDRAVAIAYYRAESTSAIHVGVLTSPRSWTRVASIREQEDQVIVEVRAIDLGIDGPGVGRVQELAIELREPLRDRTVVDGLDGATVTKRNCPWNEICP